MNPICTTEGTSSSECINCEGVTDCNSAFPLAKYFQEPHNTTQRRYKLGPKRSPHWDLRNCHHLLLREKCSARLPCQGESYHCSVVHHNLPAAIALVCQRGYDRRSR
uniref:Uncharacterized protein n=1 Tax=Coccidioides posadasii RMSCC 3488 TaxID=454284 RepID=A0A0J6HXS0_COCPO|nr:hypothetical protein CPAG_00101 [Coccidioides posadasii RMSCC 3488]